MSECTAPQELAGRDARGPAAVMLEPAMGLVRQTAAAADRKSGHNVALAAIVATVAGRAISCGDLVDGLAAKCRRVERCGHEKIVFGEEG